MLSLKNISIRYDKKTVVENLSIDFQPSLIHGLVGLNGSGKTSILNALYGIIPVFEGQIYWDGKKLSYKQIAYLETGNYFYSRITGLEYLNLFKAKNKSFNIEEWNHIFQLPLRQLIEDYSTGMKKKLALMGILSLENRMVFILDEPFNALDLESNELLKEILLRLKAKGKTILVTSHILETLTSVCDTIHFLKEKTIDRSFEKNEFEGLKNHIFENENQDKKEKIDRLID